MTKHIQHNKVLCLGSGPALPQVNDWNVSDLYVLGCNNVWRGTDKWDTIISPGDYPYKKHLKKAYPPGNSTGKNYYSEKSGMSFREAMTHYATNKKWPEAGLELGPSTYFALMYWSLYNLQPTHIACFALDMIYKPDEDKNTAFYGEGIDFQQRGMPDLHFQIYKYFDGDFSVIDTFFELLEKNRGNTQIYNLSTEPDSLLPWPRITLEEFKQL